MQKGRAQKKNFFLTTRGEVFSLVVVIALFLMVQLPTLSISPLDYDSWRQTDTYSVAVNYVQYDMNLFHPQFNYDGTSDIYVQLELEIMPYLSAVLFKLTGTTTPAIPRAISLLFFIGSSIFLYKLMKKFAGRFGAYVGYIVYMFLPISLQLSRAIMPEACCLFFYCGGLYYLYRWTETDRMKHLCAASLLTAFAIMEKLPVIFVGLVFVYAFLLKMKTSCFKSPKLYICGALTLLPPIAFYAYSGSVAASSASFVSGIATKHIFTSKIFTIFTEAGLMWFQTNLPKLFGLPVLILSFVGLLFCFEKKRRFMLFWTIAFALECAIIVAIIQFGYYLIFIAPLLSTLVAIAIGEILVWRKQICMFATTTVIVLTVYYGVSLWKDSLVPDASIEAAANFIAAHVPKEDSFAIGVVRPEYISTANRHGYRANIFYYDDIPTGAEAETNYYIEQGVKWFVVIEGQIINDDDGSYLQYVQDNFELAAQTENCAIYQMTEG